MDDAPAVAVDNPPAAGHELRDGAFVVLGSGPLAD